MTSLIVVEFPWGRDKDPRVPLGHASLIAVLESMNIEFHSFVREINDNSFDLETIVDELKAIIEHNTMIAIGAYVWAEDAIQHIMTQLRNSGFKGKIVLGGPQISYMAEGLEELYPQVDIFVRGYGEMALAALALNPEEEMPGVHRAGQKDNVTQTTINMNLMPSPWLTNVIDLNQQKFVRWESQRGCPFKCGFCQHKEPGARLKKREFSSDRVMKEIDLFCRKGVKDIAVLDPIFNSSSQSMEILNRFIANGYDGRLSLQCRAEMITDDFLDAASKLDVLLEFGLQTIHKAEGISVSRNNNMDKVEKVIAEVNRRGLNYEISLIYGLPEQTLASFKETVSWCLVRGVPTIKAFPLMLLRGTDVENRKDEWGLRESAGSMPVVLSSNTFTEDEWIEMAKLSEALKQTEITGHPAKLIELEAIARDCEVDMNRFRPEPTEEVTFRSHTTPKVDLPDGELIISYSDRVIRMCSIYN